MFIQSVLRKVAKKPRKPSLRSILIVPFVLQICAVVGLVGYFSYRNGQQGVNNFVSQLRNEINERIVEHLDTHLAVPYLINQVNANALSIGLLNERDFAKWERHLWKQIELFESVSYITFADTTGEYVGLQRLYDGSLTYQVTDFTKTMKTYSIDKGGDRGKLLKISENYEPRTRPWYTPCAESGKTQWTDFYIGVSPPILMITLCTPYYDENNTFQGILAVDLNRQRIVEFLSSLKIGKTGKAFIVERDGLIVGTSTAQSPFINAHPGQEKRQRLNVLNSSDPLVRATAEYLKQHFSNYDNIDRAYQLEFDYKGQRQFVEVSPYQDEWGLDWVIVLILPESDFMESINANNRNTIALCVAALVVSAIVAILFGRWITKPILGLNAAAKSICAGEWQQRVEVKGAKELEQLANSFNKMVTQLRESFTTLEIKNAETQRLNTSLQRLDRLKDEFLANKSHELRTPLNGIIGIAESLIDGATGTLPAQTRSNLGAIAASGKRLSTLVNDILDFSQLKHKDIKLQLQTVRLREITEVVLTVSRLLIGNKNLELKNNISVDLPPVLADENRLQQILYNLIGNAIKFTDRGTVEVSAKLVPQTDYLAISVQDTGIGIEQDRLARIFESFEQADGSTARVYGGTGLGLAVTKKLIELHGGKISVKSTPNIGSKFTFELPLAPEKATKLNAIVPTKRSNNLFLASAAENTISRGKNNHYLSIQTEPTCLPNNSDNKQWQILIVDDDAINLRVLNNYLCLCQYQVTQASSGIEVIDLLESGFQPDLILLDVMMPKMTGYEVTQKIRQKLKVDELPIILLTAKNCLEDRVIGLKLGANDYLSKPIVKEELLARIETQLTLRKETLEIKEARAKLREQNRNLEKIVARRTATLAESQRTLATLMSNLPGMAYRSANDRNWKMVFVSQGCRSLTGYNPQDLTSKQNIKYWQLIHPEDRNNVWHEVQKSLENHQPFQVIYRLLLPKSERVKWVWEQGRGVFNSEGKLLFIEGFIIDISDRIYVEKELERSNHNLQEAIAKLQKTQAELKIASAKSEAANRAKSVFLANMSHELRTPLNSIIGFAQLLNRDNSLQPSQKERIKIINSSGEYLLSLINNILDISKIEAGKINLNQSDFDLHSLLKSVEKMFVFKTKEKGIKLFLKLDSHTPQFIYTDESKLRQVLINLIGNAVKFTEQGSVTVEVSNFASEATTADTQILQFEVLDTGPGIAPDEIEKIFVPFEQTSSGRASKQGTGLGLALSQKFIQLMGGKISVQSIVGVGTCFKFKIPIRLSLDPRDRSDRNQKVVALAPSQPQYKILIVDDVAENRQSLSELLTSVGFLVKQASNGVEAVKIWQDWHPSLIWMDLRMPEMDGYEATRQIRAIEARQSSNSIIIALTASALTEEREKILKSGFDNYVFKPFQESIIWSTLIQYLKVEFIYQEAETKMTEPTEPDDEPLEPLTSEALSKMPCEWLRELKEAASHLEGKRVLELIGQIEAEYPDLARQLSDLARDYQFEQIIELICEI